MLFFGENVNVIYIPFLTQIHVGGYQYFIIYVKENFKFYAFLRQKK